ncbi:hypothetical protein [Hyphobacterium sp.]|uniref:hypothetical protein n=1 Tax=Hyphobacterium sp. TaxID=2004662 RepID=UPI003B5230FD
MTWTSRLCRAAERPMLWSVLLAAAFVMLSWKAGFEPGVRIIPGAAPMQFNTALCFGLLAIAGLRRHQPDMKWWAVAALLLAALTLVQDYSRVNAGIDQAFQRAWYFENTPEPGRMAPFTAVGFILIAAVRLTNRAPVAILLLGVVVLRAGAALIGYGIETAELYQIAEDKTAMAVHTAALFAAYSTVEICRLHARWRRRTGKEST